MTPREFCRTHRACSEGRAWAQFATMAECWDALMANGDHPEWAWWIVSRALSPQARTALVCRVVRGTPVGDGRTVWDLLADERSRTALAMAEAWARDEVADTDLQEAAYAAARFAADAAARFAADAAYADARSNAARSDAYVADAAFAAAYTAYVADATYDAAYAALCAVAGSAAAFTAAWTWQMAQLRTLPNPFEAVRR